MTPDERAALLGIARAAVAAAVRGREPPPADGLPAPLAEKGAAFVTLRCGGDLRGCIGHLRADRPLWRSVQEMAAAAAQNDSRFEPLRPEELASLSVDISVLSPIKRARPEEVRVGTHGLYLRLGWNSGLLLPQVAVEWKWDAQEFLRQTCRKAGLPPDAWLDPDAELFLFTAEVFGD